MENQTQDRKRSLVAIGILALLAVAYFLISKNDFFEKQPVVDNAPEAVEIENTPTVNGVMVAPNGLPEDIPIENGKIIESVTSNYPELGSKLLTITYESDKTVEEKYVEYKDYLTGARYYEVTESGTDSLVKSISGIKGDVNLSVVVSVRGGKTLVQLAYLFKSTQ